MTTGASGQDRPVDLKDRVRDRWESEVCGSRYGTEAFASAEYFETIDAERYRQDFMLQDFARFGEARDLDLLEVGLGTGADYCRWALAGARAHGVDLTEASAALVRSRLNLEGLTADVRVGDAARPLPEASFDLYYTWGCSTTPPTPRRPSLRPTGPSTWWEHEDHAVPLAERVGLPDLASVSGRPS